MFELRGVSKSFGKIVALGPTNLSIAQEKNTVLIGPSGSGKSTVLRLLIGLLRPDSGEVLFEGEALVPHNLVAIRRRMGYVIQEGGLFPHLTAAQNITLMAKAWEWSLEEISRRLAQLCSLTRFPEDALDRYPTQLSGGQRQRVSLMRALMLDPHVLLLDEPLGALDPLIRAELQEDLKRIFQMLSKTVVLVTHDLSEACFFGDVLVLFREGVIVQQGTAAELLRAPADPFVSRFVSAQRKTLEGVAR